MKSQTIKKKFLNYFKKNGYIEINESNLIPIKDDSILFTNSGMVQFKNIFLGIEQFKYDKVITSQTCVRLGGKHNDLDNIGQTVHHNTSFTMLGNFCFKNASKKEAIFLAWHFLIDVLLLEKNKLYITVHKDDFESFNIWAEFIKVEISHITKGSDDTNFWSMDESGPCGYCSEIFYNIGSDKTNLLEIWNLVFMQFEKKNNKLEKLDNLFIDTGMGLERISSIKQGVFDNFETDILKPLLDITKKFFNVNYNDQSIKIITDHLKTCVLLILNGLNPSNFGRGYILKKLIRRAIINKKKINPNVFLFDLIEDFVNFLNKKFICNVTNIKNIIKFEENKFEQTLNHGISFLYNSINNKKEIDGKILFKLYDTYGIPLYVLNNILDSDIINNNLKDFNIEMENQIKISKKKTSETDDKYSFLDLEKTIFSYNENLTNSKIIKIIKNNEFCNSVFKNDECIIILKNTCFYPEKGGQIGDSGKIENLENVFDVFDTKDFNGVIFHYGKVLNGLFSINDLVFAKINIEKRFLTSINHTATHLLHSALKSVLGNHIKQSGSLINDEYLRFDFVHFNALSDKEISKIEDFINNYIKLNIKTRIKILNLNSNLEKNRIVFLGKNISKEFCAGTHVKNSGDIKFFKIIKEFGVGANTRRIEAVTNDKVRIILNENVKILDDLSKKLNTQKNDLSKFIESLLNKNKILKKDNELLMLENIKYFLNHPNNQRVLFGIKVVAIEKKKEYLNVLKGLISSFFKTIIIFYNFENESIFINIYVSNDILFVDAAKIIENLKNKFHIKGGGNSKIASGIVLEKNIDNIINDVYLYVESSGKKIKE